MDNLRKCLALTGIGAVGVIGTLLIIKAARRRHAGLAEKTGHAIDASIIAAAKKLEKTAITLEEWANGGMGKDLGKGLDEALTDTKKTLEKATDLVQGALNHAK